METSGAKIKQRYIKMKQRVANNVANNVAKFSQVELNMKLSGTKTEAKWGQKWVNLSKV